MKSEWIVFFPHLLAQEAAYFLLWMLGVIVLAGWLEWRRG